MLAICSASSIDGIQNFGDELLTQMYQGWVDEVLGEGESRHLQMGRWGLGTRGAARVIGSADRILYSGGGYFADGYLGTGRRFRQHLRALRNRSIYGGVHRSGVSRRLPWAVMGLEVGPVRNPVYRRTVTDILRNAQLVVVRNEESLMVATELRGTEDHLHLRLDAALALEPAQEESPEDEASRPIRVGLHLHSFPSDDAAETVLRLLRELRSHFPHGSTVEWVYIHDQKKNGAHPKAAVAAQRWLAERLGQLEVIPYENADSTLRSLATLNLILTTKLHIGIVGRAFDIPVLALGTHPKIARFFDALGEAPMRNTAEYFLREGLPDVIEQRAKGGFAERLPPAEHAKVSALGNKALLQQWLDPEEAERQSR